MNTNYYDEQQNIFSETKVYCAEGFILSRQLVPCMVERPSCLILWQQILSFIQVEKVVEELNSLPNLILKHLVKKIFKICAFARSSRL